MPDLARPQCRFVTEPLSEALLLPTYPLIRDAGPFVPLAAWLRFARPLAAARPLARSLARPWARRGAMVVRRVASPYPCGLFCYRSERDLLHGLVLWAEHFVVIDMIDPDAALGALLEGLDGLSRRLGCRVVRAVVDADEPIGRRLRAGGHRADGTTLIKPVPAPTGAITSAPTGAIMSAPTGAITSAPTGAITSAPGRRR